MEAQAVDETIKNLIQCLRRNEISHCNLCTYKSMDSECRIKLRDDTIKLIQALKPIKPVKDGNGCLICGNQKDGCGVVGKYDIVTGKTTERIDNYCAFCGKKVKWDD